MHGFAVRCVTTPPRGLTRPHVSRGLPAWQRPVARRVRVCGVWLQAAGPGLWPRRRRLAKVRAPSAQPLAATQVPSKLMTDSQAAAHQHGGEPGASQRRHRPAHHQGHARGAARGVRRRPRCRRWPTWTRPLPVTEARARRAGALLCWRRARSPSWCSWPRSSRARWCWMSAAPRGYSTAVLAQLAGKVVARGVRRGLGERAAADAARARRRQCAPWSQGPLAAGVPAQAPFDAILLNGAVPQVPQELLEQLKDGGRLVGVVSPTAASAAPRSGGAPARPFDARAAFDAGAEPLPGFARKAGSFSDVAAARPVACLCSLVEC